MVGVTCVDAVRLWSYTAVGEAGATEADLEAATTLCNRENVHFGRNNMMIMGPDEEVMVTNRQKRYRRGAGEMMQK